MSSSPILIVTQPPPFQLSALAPQRPSMGRQEARHSGYKHGVRASAHLGLDSSSAAPCVTLTWPPLRLQLVLYETGKNNSYLSHVSKTKKPDRGLE